MISFNLSPFYFKLNLKKMLFLVMHCQCMIAGAARKKHASWPKARIKGIDAKIEVRG